MLNKATYDFMSLQHITTRGHKTAAVLGGTFTLLFHYSRRAELRGQEKKGETEKKSNKQDPFTYFSSFIFFPGVLEKRQQKLKFLWLRDLGEKKKVSGCIFSQLRKSPSAAADDKR